MENNQPHSHAFFYIAIGFLFCCVLVLFFHSFSFQAERRTETRLVDFRLNRLEDKVGRPDEKIDLQGEFRVMRETIDDLKRELEEMKQK